MVSYDGKLVRSTHQGLNHWTPGVLNYDGRIWEILETSTQPDTPETSEQPAVPAWKPGIVVNPGQKYTHNGTTYEVVQAHTTQAGWEPPAVPALWKKL